jgi:hypothetical protein
MSRPDTPFPRHWRHYTVAVVAVAIMLAPKLLGAF